MKIVYGILTFVVGFILIFISGGIFSPDGPMQVTNSTFKSGMMALCVAIIFLCGVIVVCTLMIISALNNKK